MIKKIFLFLFSLYVLSLPAILHAQEERAVRVPPVFWYEYDPVAKRRFVMALMLYWHAKDDSESLDLLAPFFYNSETPQEKLRILLPLHFLYKTADMDMSLWGPYFSRSTKDSKIKLVFPLYFDTLSKESRFTLFALYLRQENQRYRSKTVLPLFWSYIPKETGRTSYQVLFPLYYKSKELDERLIISPLFFSYKDSEVSQGLAIPYFWRHSKTSKTEVGFPLYWRFLWQKKDGFRDVQVALPWFRYSTKRSTIRSFLPIYWGWKRNFEDDQSSGALKSSSWDMLLPFYFRSENPDGSTKNINPFFSKIRDRDGREYGHGLLSFYVRDTWGGKTEGMFPFFSYREEADYYRFRCLPLYLKRYKNDEHSDTFLFPIFRYRRDYDRRQLLTPLFYYDSDPDLSRGYFLTYFWKTERRPNDPARTVLASKRYFFPFYWHFHSETQDTTVFSPLAAFHEHENYKLSFFLPFYYKRQKDDDILKIVFPVISRSTAQKNWYSILFIFWNSKREGSSSVAFLPLFRKSKFPGGESILLPGYYHLKALDGDQGVAGLYLWDTRGKTQYEMLLPLYVHFKRPTWQLKAFFPVYDLKTRTIEEKGFFPIWAVTKSINNSTASVTRWEVSTASAAQVAGRPAGKQAVSEKPDAGGVSFSTETFDLQEEEISTHPITAYLADSHRVLPFYLYRKLPNGSDLVLPIILGDIEKTKDEKGQKTTKGRLFLVSFWETSPKSFVSRLDPIYAYYREPDRKGFTVPTAPFPLWSHEVEGLKDPKNMSVRGSFFPYYWKYSRSYRRDMVFPIFYKKKEKSEDGLKEMYRITWLINYYSNYNTPEEKGKTLFVPLYWRFVNKGEIRTVVFPVWTEKGANYKKNIVFPLWWYFERDKAKLSVFFPLYINSSDPVTKSKTTIIPGYWNSEDRFGSTLLAGIYFRKRDYVKKEETTVTFPLYWSNTSPEKAVRTVFPLWWQWKMGERKVTYLFPLYFHHKRENLDWKISFPFYWQFVTDDRKVTVIPPYFSIVSFADQTKTNGFAPVWTYARNARQDWKDFQVFGGLFRYERTGAVKHVTILYFIKI